MLNVSLRLTAGGSGEASGCFPLSISSEICGFTIMWTSVLQQMIPPETSCGRITAPSQDQVLNVFQPSPITHSCVWTPRLGGGGRGCGWGREAVFIMFWWHSRFAEFLKWRPQRRQRSQSFCFLLDFLKLLPRGRRGWGRGEGEKNQESLKRFIKGIKNLKATPLVSIKGPGWRKPRYAVNSYENTLDKAAVHAKKKKVCPKAIQSIAQLAAIIKRRSGLRSAPHQPAELQLTPWMHRDHKDAAAAAADSTGNYMLASLLSSSRSNIMRWPNHSAVSKRRHIQTTELSTQAERPV